MVDSLGHSQWNFSTTIHHALFAECAEELGETYSADCSLLRGFEFRITDTLGQYLGGSNFELLVHTIFISRVSELRNNFRQNYARIFLLFQRVLEQSWSW